MALASPSHKLQDWITQQWVILRGRRIDPQAVPWLMGPIGAVGVAGKEFISRVAQKEHLVLEGNQQTRGLIPSINDLNLSETDLAHLSSDVIRFYENTMGYNLRLSVSWNPSFRVFGVLLYRLFSMRISQLNIPTSNGTQAEPLQSEIISLYDPLSGQAKYTFWFRTIKSTGQVIYAGAYGLTTLPSGKTCIKSVFPLPNGNATVIMSPTVGHAGELILDASGATFGDPGFYFMLKDRKGNHWSHYVKSFHDRLTVRAESNHLSAEQVITLWGRRVLSFSYEIEEKNR